MISRVWCWALFALMALCSDAAAMDGRLPGSVLVYPIHRSGPNFTILSATNTALDSQTPAALGGGTGISWRYINVVPSASPLVPLDCTMIERIEFLTPGDTTALLAGCQNGGGDREGFVVLSAQDPNYFKTDWSHNFLIGSEFVVNQAGGAYMLNAVPFKSPQPKGSHTDNDIPGFNGPGMGDGDREIDFDGVEYEAVPDDLYADSFMAVAGSSLTLLNLSGGSFFKATVGLDIWNDNEHPMSATFQFRCWFEEELADLSPVFSQFHLYNNTPHDPLELDVDCDQIGDVETGWFRVRGLEYSSDVDTCLNPAVLGAITAGPTGNINGGHLLWESNALQINGDFYKFASDDPECPEPIPVDPICDAGASPIELEVGEQHMFDGSASMDPDGMIVDFLWDFGDGTISPTPMASHSYAAPGPYTAILMVTDNDGRGASCTVDVIVNAPPMCDAGPALTGDLDDTFTFDATGSSDPDGAILTYDWDFGDGTTVLDAGPTPTHTYAAPGDYTVELTVTDDSGRSVTCMTSVSVNGAPTCDAGVALAGNDGDTFTFDATGSSDGDGTIESYDWDFGDGTTALDAGPMPSHTYAAPGDYTVMLTVTDDDGTQVSCEVQVSVNDFPVCDAGVDLAGDDGDTFTFDATGSSDSDGTIESYDWDFGDGNTALDAGPTPSHTYAAPGDYTVTVTLTDDDGAQVSCGIQVSVNAFPVCDAGPDQAGTEDDTFTFDASGSVDPDGSIVTYDWDFGDGNTALDAGPTVDHTYVGFGTFTVTLVVTDDDGATSTCTLTVEVNGKPLCDAGGPYAGNVGETIVFDGTGSSDPDGSIATYDWFWGDGSSDLDAGPTPGHVYAAGGTYTVELRVTDDEGAVVTCQAMVEINEFPVCAFGPDQTGDENDTFSFDASASSDGDGSIATYDWDFGDGNTALDAGPTVTHTYVGFGSFTVTLTLTDDDGAVSICTIQVDVNGLPLCEAGGPYAGNVGEPIAFDGSGSSDPDGMIVRYDWSFGDGSPLDVDAGPMVSHVYAAPGQYTVTLRIFDEENAQVVCTAMVDVNAFPVCNAGVDLAGNDGDTFTFDATGSSDADGTIATYDWDFGDGTLAPNAGPMPSHTYASPGDHTATVTITDDDGAQVNCQVAVSVNAFPLCNAGPTITGTLGDTFTFDASASSDPDGTIATYGWDFGDGTVVLDAGPMPTHTYTDGGVFTVVVTITDDDGASVNCQTTADVNLPPVCVAPAAQSGNVGDVIVFNSAGSMDPDGTIVSGEWDFGDGSTAMGSVVSHVYTAPGVYTVTLTLTDDDGAVTTCPTTATINAFPICVPGPDLVGNENDTFTFDAGGSSDPDGSIVRYDWDFGDGTTALDAGPMPSHTYVGFGTFTVTVTITDDDGATSSCMLQVDVNGLPLCDAGGPYTGNVGEPIMFDGSGSSDPDGMIVRYDWAFDDGSPLSVDAGPMVSHVYAAPGSYTVTLRIFDEDNAPVICQTMVDINAFPTCDAGVDLVGDDGDTFTFDATGSFDSDGTIVSYDWDFGDGTLAPGAGPMPSHTYAAPGDYTATVTITDDDGAQIDCQVDVSVNGFPTCEAGPSQAGTEDDTFSFDATGSFDSDGTIVTYDWDFGDGNTALDAGPMVSHTYVGFGSFTVTLTVTDDDGAVTTCTTAVDVNGKPLCDAGGPYAGNAGELVALSGLGSSDPDGVIVRYDWDYGDGTSDADAGPTPSHAWAASGSYVVTLTITDDLGAMVSCTTPAIINAFPDCDAGGPYSGNVGDTITLDGSLSSDPDGTIAQYDWVFGDGSAPAQNAGPSTTHVYNAAGTYTVTLRVTDDDGAMVTCTTTVVINGFPTCDAGGPYAADVGETVTFDGSGSMDSDGTIVRYDWDFGDGSPVAMDAGVAPTHVYAAFGSYTVTLTVADEDGASTTCMADVSINAPPLCSAGLPDPPTSSVGDVITFDGTGSSDPDGTIASFMWDFGDGNTATGPVVQHAYGAPGNFVITLTITDDTGTSVSCGLLTGYFVNDPPTCDAGGPYQADLFDEVTFDGSGSMDSDGTIATYDWDFGDGATALDAGPMPMHTYTDIGQFTVTLTVTDDFGRSETCTTVVDIGAHSGAIVLSGDDTDQHCPAILCGAMGPKLFQWVLDNSENQGQGILCVGLRETDFMASPPLFSLAKLNFDTWMPELSPPLDPDPAMGDIRLVSDPAEFLDPAQTNFDDYRMIFIPSFSGHTPGGITQAMLDALLARKADLEDYVMRRGGGLLALTQATDSAFMPQVMNGWAWSPIPVTTNDIRYFEVCPSTVGLNGLAGVYPAPLPGTDCSMVTNTGLSHEAWHNTFLSDPVNGFFGLDEFATGNEAVVIGEASVIGGIPDPPQFPAPGPGRVQSDPRLGGPVNAAFPR